VLRPAVVVLGGASVDCVAYLRDFGSANRAATFARSANPELTRRQDGDPFRSVLDDESYGEFDRELFIATLDDWGWFGAGQPPAWYTGKGLSSSDPAIGDTLRIHSARHFQDGRRSYYEPAFRVPLAGDGARQPAPPISFDGLWQHPSQ
jgi:hypothetical protein